MDTPIGMCEMRAFMFVAKLHFSEVMGRLGHLNTARKLYQQAHDLMGRFNEKFCAARASDLRAGGGSAGRLLGRAP